MITAHFTDLSRPVEVYGPWQHDHGQQLQITGITGLTPVTQVHFAKEGASKAEIRAGAVTDNVLTVTIPDAMFLTPQDWWAYVYLTDGDSGNTVCGVLVRYGTHTRPAPDDTVTPDDVSLADALTAQLNALIATVEGVNNAAAGSAAEAAANATSAGNSAAAADSSKTAAQIAATNAGNSASAAAGSASSAERSATTAGEAATVAGTARDEAVSAKDITTAARDTTVAAKESAVAAKDTAVAKANEAVADAASANVAKAAAQTAQAVSEGARDTAVTAAGTATTKAGEASTNATAASTAKAGAETARDAAVVAKTASESARDAAIAALGQFGIKKYTVSFSGSSPVGTRLDSAIGKVANVAVDGATVVNDFDSVPFFNRPICCCTWNATMRKWRVNAYRGEPGFAADGSNGEVMYECTPFYFKVNADLSYVSVTATPCEGYTLAPMFPDGHTKVYCPSYWLGMVEGVATSRNGTHPHYNSLNGHMTDARTFDAKGHLETSKIRFSEYLLQLVEFATRDVQTVMMGACNVAYNGATDTIASVISSTSFTTTSTVGARFTAGQTVSIGSTQNGEQRTARVVVNSITTVDSVSTWVLAEAVSNLTIGDYLSSRAWINGATDIVTASSGSPGSNTSGRYPCIWRGKVDPWGDAFSWLCDLLVKREGAGTTESPYIYTPYYLSDPTLYNAGAITTNYVRASFKIPGADGYAMTLSKDNQYSHVFLTTALGTSSTTYLAAYYYYPRYDIGAVRVGGLWNGGRSCSPVCFDCRSAPSDSFIYSLARLFVAP